MSASWARDAAARLILRKKLAKSVIVEKL